MISSAKTLGMFQIESPGQRELVGKSGLDSFEDIITDISLFRPGPVKSDMITPYLEGKQGWKTPTYLHDDLRPILGGTQGVVVFHEQVIEMIAQFAGISLRRGRREAAGPRRRRGDGRDQGCGSSRARSAAATRCRWSSGSGRCSRRSRRSASARPTPRRSRCRRSSRPGSRRTGRRTSWPGVLTHDPGMYPKRLILDDARQLGLAILGLDVNASEKAYVVERVGAEPTADARRHQAGAGRGEGHQRGRGRADRRGPAVPLADRLLAPRPGVPADRGAAGAGRGVRRGLRHRPRRAG